MANIRVKKITTGEEGMMPEENFRPDLYQRIPEIGGFDATLEKGPGKVEDTMIRASNAAPTIGAIGVPLLTDILSGGYSVPATAGLAGAGYMGGSGVGRLIDSFRRTLYTPKHEFKLNTENIKPHGDPAENMNYVGSTLAGSAMTALISALIGYPMQKMSDIVLGPAGKIGKGPIPPLTPGGIKKAGSAEAKNTGSKIGEMISKEADRKMSVNEYMKTLQTLYDEAENTKDIAAMRKIKDVMRRLTSEGQLGEQQPLPISLKRAFQTKVAFGRDIFGDAGKELNARGNPGVLQKEGKQMVADKMSDDVINELVKAGYKDAPKIFEKYGALANKMIQMEQPYKDFYKGAIISTLMSAMGMPEIGIPVGSTITAGSMPYTRTLIQQILGNTIPSSIRYGVTGGGSSYLNKILNPNISQ